MGAFKLDRALSGPVPWKARECARAATVHLGGTLEEIAVSEDSAWSGKHVEKPFGACWLSLRCSILHAPRKVNIPSGVIVTFRMALHSTWQRASKSRLSASRPALET